MLWDLVCRVIGLLFLLLSVLLIIRSVLATRASGFKFYLFVHLIGSLPLMLSSLILFMPQDDSSGSVLNAMLLIYIVLPTMQVVEERQQKKARVASPAQWAAWESEAKHARPLKRFFYPRITQQKQPNNNSASDARSNKIFLTSMIFMAVAGLIGVVLIVLILLSRRGI